MNQLWLIVFIELIRMNIVCDQKKQWKQNSQLTLGILSLLQTASDNNLSRISHAKMLGHSRL